MDWKRWARDRGLQKWFKRDNFIILVLAGVLLIIVALPVRDREEAGGNLEGDKTERNTILQSGSGTSANGGNNVQESGSDQAYAADVEKRLTESLSQIAGVGKVKVMITLKSSQELVVEKEQPTNRSSSNESDSQGGSRITSQAETGDNTVYRTEGSLSEPYVIKTLPPQIEGVLVVAEGAGNGTVNRTIVEIIQALFGVEAHKVQVVKME